MNEQEAVLRAAIAKQIIELRPTAAADLNEYEAGYDQGLAKAAVIALGELPFRDAGLR